jgi:hypothetical protein
VSTSREFVLRPWESRSLQIKRACEHCDGHVTYTLEAPRVVVSHYGRSGCSTELCLKDAARMMALRGVES